VADDDPGTTADARNVAAALADEDRLRLFARVLLATPPGLGMPDLVDLPRSSPRAVAQQVAKLVSAGLLVRAADGWLTARAELFRVVLRALDEQDRTAPPDAGVDRAVDALFQRGRLVNMPVKPDLRHRLLERLVTDFEPGTTYTELEVRDILQARYNDHATLRRYLVDDGLMHRDSRGAYWRPVVSSGG